MGGVWFQFMGRLKKLRRQNDVAISFQKYSLKVFLRRCIYKVFIHK